MWTFKIIMLPAIIFLAVVHGDICIDSLCDCKFVFRYTYTSIVCIHTGIQRHPFQPFTPPYTTTKRLFTYLNAHIHMQVIGTNLTNSPYHIRPLSVENNGTLNNKEITLKETNKTETHKRCIYIHIHTDIYIQ